MYYTYLLQSSRDGLWYTGATADLRTRIRDHMKGRVTSTHYRRPLTLIYYEACLSEADAKRRERYLRQRLAAWLAENSPE